MLCPPLHFFHLPIDMAQVPLLAFEELLGALDDHAEINPIDSGRINRAITVISGLMLSIMISTPMIVVTEVITCVALVQRLMLRVSTSLVILTGSLRGSSYQNSSLAAG